MHRYSFLIFGILLLAGAANAKEFYVAPNGKDTNPGTKQQPFESIMKAQEMAAPGDIVYLRGGTYAVRENQVSRQQGAYACINFLDKSGTEGKPISYLNAPGEKPVFDFSAVKPENRRVAAFYVTGSWLHFKGFEVVGVQVTQTGHTQSEAFENHGSHNIYEQLAMHDSQAIGFYLLEGSYNLILNCDAYRNYDYTSEGGKGGNSDGFGNHPRKGSVNNVFRGCRAWFNSDDGYDCINASEATVFENCWAFYNGYSSDFKPLADGNGFKAGGYGAAANPNVPTPIPNNTVQFCLSVGNKASGFYSNHHMAGSFWYNNTAYKNGTNFNMLNRKGADVSVPGFDHTLKNNIAYKARGKELDNIDIATCTQENNSFNMQVQLSDKDFITLDEKLLTAPRKADGSLPDTGFMVPVKGSALGNLGYRGKK
jgi:hypothetical protein